MTNPFDEERLFGARSALVKMTPDDQGRFQFELWTQYTRRGLDALEVGDLAGIENYSPIQEDGLRTFSILSLTQVYPLHFATQGPDAYPGHVFESMRSIKEDWERQTDRPLHPTTTIRATAISTGWQFKYNPRITQLPRIQEEKNLPMTGAEVRPLSMNMVNAIINQGMDEQPASPFNHKKFGEINIRLDIEALLTTHFGIFGFTGVGKSNLVSSMVVALSTPTTTTRANIVLIDPNDEYLGLLIDRFIDAPNDMLYVHVGTDSLPEVLLPYIGIGAEPATDHVLQVFYQQMKLPRRLAIPELEPYFRNGLRNALERTRIVLPTEDLPAMIELEIHRQIDPRAGPAVKEVLQDILDAWIEETRGQAITSANILRGIEILRAPVTGIISHTATYRDLDQSKRATVNSVIGRVERYLRRTALQLEQIPPRAIIPMVDILVSLNNRELRQTIIVTSRRDSDIKLFTETLGNELYEARRIQGIAQPMTLFIFDEADLFLPLDATDEATNRIKEFCIILARRGRKFGLGICISTQRVALLSTEVMGNLHTYLISKLPRQLDRQRIAEAFGIGEEQLTPTFTFRPGNWLLISHDSTGLKGVPIPTTATDANARILRSAGLEP